MKNGRCAGASGANEEKSVPKHTAEERKLHDAFLLLGPGRLQ